MFYFHGLGNADFVGDAISQDDAEGVAKELVAILGHCFRYRIASAIDSRRAIDVYRVIAGFLNAWHLYVFFWFNAS